jgi:hypothetical protein
MAAIFDMTRRVTMHDVEDINLKNVLEEAEPDSAPPLVPSAVIFFNKTIEKLPDRVLRHIFSYLPSQQLLRVGKVCKKWKKVANSPALWRSVSFRASHGGLQVRF